MDRQKNWRGDKEWMTLKDFFIGMGSEVAPEAKNHDVVVRVNVLMLSEPIYSMEVGTVGPLYPGKLARHVREGKVQDVFTLLTMAMEFIAGKKEERIKEMEDEVKKAKERKAQYLENVERRREENRQRAHGGKKGR